MKYIHCGIIQLNRVQTQIHQGLLSKLFSVKSLDAIVLYLIIDRISWQGPAVPGMGQTALPLLSEQRRYGRPELHSRVAARRNEARERARRQAPSAHGRIGCTGMNDPDRANYLASRTEIYPHN
jgi:hypothetical protein